MKKLIKYSSIVILVLILGYPIFLWTKHSKYTGRIGNLTPPLIAQYSTQFDTLKIYRFKVQEHFKHPFFTKIDMEFFTFNEDFSNKGIKEIHLDSIYIVGPGLREIPYLPDSFSAIDTFMNEITYKRTFLYEEKYNDPEFSFFSQFSYGPTLDDTIGGVCD